MLVAQHTNAKDTTRGLRTQHNKRFNKHKQKNNNNDVDIIAKEDVAFFTQISRSLSIPMPRPTPFPTPRPNPPPTPNVTPAPVPVPPVPNPTNPPVTQTQPPVPAPPGNTPIARPDSASVLGIGDLAFVAVLANDTPAQGQTLTVKSVTAASNGDCSIGLDLLEVVYSPNPGFTGTDSCDYEACDAQPECDTATITFTVGTTRIVTKSGEVDAVQQAYGNIAPQDADNIVQNGYANIVPNRGSSRQSGKSGKGSGKSGKASSGKSGKGSSKSSKGSRGGRGYSRRQY